MLQSMMNNVLWYFFCCFCCLFLFFFALCDMIKANTVSNQRKLKVTFHVKWMFEVRAFNDTMELYMPRFIKYECYNAYHFLPSIGFKWNAQNIKKNWTNVTGRITNTMESIVLLYCVWCIRFLHHQEMVQWNPWNFVNHCHEFAKV